MATSVTITDWITAGVALYAALLSTLTFWRQRRRSRAKLSLSTDETTSPDGKRVVKVTVVNRGEIDSPLTEFELRGKPGDQPRITDIPYDMTACKAIYAASPIKLSPSYVLSARERVVVMWLSDVVAVAFIAGRLLTPRPIRAVVVDAQGRKYRSARITPTFPEWVGFELQLPAASVESYRHWLQLARTQHVIAVVKGQTVRGQHLDIEAVLAAYDSIEEQTGATEGTITPKVRIPRLRVYDLRQAATITGYETLGMKHWLGIHSGADPTFDDAVDAPGHVRSLQVRLVKALDNARDDVDGLLPTLLKMG